MINNAASMKSNSQIQLSPRLYLGDVDGDKVDEIIQVDGRHIYVFKPTFDFIPVLEYVFPFPVRRLIIGDFTNYGREYGREQIGAILSDGSLQVFAISDDLKSLWWWFTQPNFVGDDEQAIVGDFDGDGADDLLVYKPATGGIRLYSRMETGFFAPMPNFSLGNLAGVNLINKQLLAGDFGQALNRKDILVVDYQGGQIMRFDSVTDSAGTKTFWWAFTTRGRIFQPDDQVRVTNVNGAGRDGVIIRNFNTGQYSFYQAEYVNGYLGTITDVEAGQLPVRPRAGKIVATKVRHPAFRGEPGGLRRDDVLFFDENTGELICTDARFDPSRSRLTYWWSFSSNLLFEPNITASSRPWAIILCRFKGLPGDANIEKLFRQLFTPGSGGLVEYWHDVSLGTLDISGSRILGWVELDMKREDAGGKRREVLIDAAIAAARRAGLDPTTGFHSQIAVLTHNWAKDGAPPGADYSDPVWGRYWIDGSSDGLRISSPPREHNGTFIAHEMGHGFGFNHDLAPDLVGEYGDPYCIMSAMRVRTFTHPAFNLAFGPAMSFPQLMLQNRVYPRRVHWENSNWVFNPAGVFFHLGPLSDRTANASLGVVLPQDSAASWSYYLEYMRPIGWNKGIGNPKLIIRRLGSGTAAYLGEINVPATVGERAEWTEPSGRVRFQAEKAQPDGRAIKVTAKKNT
jgi:hypothetical protein